MAKRGERNAHSLFRRRRTIALSVHPSKYETNLGLHGSQVDIRASVCNDNADHSSSLRVSTDIMAIFTFSVTADPVISGLTVFPHISICLGSAALYLNPGRRTGGQSKASRAC